MKSGFFALFFLLCIQVQAQTPKSRGNAFNPDIGMNGLFGYRNGSRGNDATSLPTYGYRNGFNVDEIELQFSSDVDPYLRAVGNFALAQDPTGAWEIEPEEVYGETIGLSFVNLRFGKISAVINKHSVLHTHAFPFVDAPLINTELLGDEGVRESGVSLAALLPTSWYTELTLQALAGENTVLFNSSSTNDSVFVAYLDFLFDLTDDLTFQLGTSYTNGQNVFEMPTSVVGGDVSFKWKPEGKDNVKSLKWVTHLLSGNQGDPAGNTMKKGVTSYLQWQTSQRWWVQARTETADQNLASVETQKRKNSALIAFVPSEFSTIRTQYDQLEDGVEPLERRFTLQLNWSIGAHPAHQY